MRKANAAPDDAWPTCLTAGCGFVATETRPFPVPSSFMLQEEGVKWRPAGTKAVAHPRSCRGRYGWQATARRSGPPKRSAHRQLSDTGGPGQPGVFGDRDLIQNALFLGAKLLSKDKGVKKRRRYVACVVPKAHRAMEGHLVLTCRPFRAWIICWNDYPGRHCVCPGLFSFAPMEL